MLFLKNISVRSFGSDQVYISVVGMSRVEFSEVSTINLCFIKAKVDDQCLRFDLSQTNFILESGQETPTACRWIRYPSLPCCWITLFYWVKIFALTFWYQFVLLDENSIWKIWLVMKIREEWLGCHHETLPIIDISGSTPVWV